MVIDYPPNTASTDAFVDSMATFWIVDDPKHIYSITNANPGFTINTANGAVGVKAVGTALAYLRTGDTWQCYEVPNVLLLPGCEATLYSTRVMNSAFGFSHHIEDGHITTPKHGDVPIHDSGAAYTTQVAFVPRGAPRPDGVNLPVSPPPIAALATASAFPAGVSGTPQAVLHQRLAFPYAEQWKHVTSASVDHGLPPNSIVSPNLPVRDAVTRGRARAIPCMRAHPGDVTQPPPGAAFYMDFAGPLLPSIHHRFVCYACVVDAGSGYGRLYPAHHMTAVVATTALAAFTAEIGYLMGFHGTFKPYVVRSDQGSAFVSHHFREFLSDRQTFAVCGPVFACSIGCVLLGGLGSAGGVSACVRWDSSAVGAAERCCVVGGRCTCVGVVRRSGRDGVAFACRMR